MRNSIIIIFVVFFSSHAFSAVDMILYSNNGNTYNLKEESKKETNILLSTSFKYNSETIDISVIDSIKIGDALYIPIIYKNKKQMARVLFLGEKEGYKTLIDEKKEVLLKEKDKDGFIKITKENKIGTYNYLFNDCIKKNPKLLKIKSNTNDIDITTEITKKLNCTNNPYKIYVKPKKIDIYLGAIGVMNMYFPNVKVSENVPNHFLSYDKTKKSLNYSVGGKIGFVINDKLDISVAISYINTSAKFTSNVYTTYFTVKDTVNYTGIYLNKSIDIDFNFKYLFLKSKLTPTISGSVYYSQKMKNKIVYQYTDSNGEITKELAASAIGISFNAGVNYKPINRISLFLDIGYKTGFGLFGPLIYKINEGFFNTTLGLNVKLNK